MSTEIKKEIKLEIGHVLFMDIVGYSKLLINEQRTAARRSIKLSDKPSNFAKQMPLAR